MDFRDVLVLIEATMKVLKKTDGHFCPILPQEQWPNIHVSLSVVFVSFFKAAKKSLKYIFLPIQNPKRFLRRGKDRTYERLVGGWG